MQDFSFVANAHPSYVDQLYQNYKNEPGSVEESWQSFFKGFDYAANGNGSNNANGSIANVEISSDKLVHEMKVLSLIKGYRNRGHLLSTTNPIRERKDRNPTLALEDFGLSEKDLDTVFFAGNEIGIGSATIRDIIAHLKKGYCGNIGFEFEHIQDREKRRWLRTRIEKVVESAYGLTKDKKRRILDKLNGAVGFESFLDKKYIGQKRFSLEGGESIIAGLDAVFTAGAEDRVEEFIIGMAHRGRLNVLANIMGKTYEHIFNEFEGTAIPDQSFGDGDVKYHLGYSSQVETLHGKKVHLKLAPNPSHLESVNPVVEGFSRAKADILYGSDYDRIMPILIHGDAAIAGQGVVYEVVQMSELEGYDTGGTLHFVINNQIGFTTDYEDARSSTYCTGVAGVVQAPVFHVNGDDPEAVVFVSELAVAYRQEFNDDVFIDMVCYRKHGHNEGDDPSFTQPEMYALIKKHQNPREIYTQKLLQRGDIDEKTAKRLEKEFWDNLQQRLDNVKENPLPYELQEPEIAWRELRQSKPKDFDASPETGIERAKIEQIASHLMTYPDDLNPIGKIDRLIRGKKKLLKDNLLDWAMAELIAYGSILMEGKDVRMSGQDVKRGTFSHRHAILNDNGTKWEYNRINDLQKEQGKFRIYNSLLSEFAVMGFEYGYSLATPNALVIWEAQFGDFYNGAQTIVDQYITAAESKWQRMSGLILLLPHGYEGQGPEHSSARLERFLQSCAEYNITVANCTTPANFFHLVRRQLARPFRKPLVVMSPKSLLRHPEVVSNMTELETGTKFQEVLDDAAVGARGGKKIKRLLLCTGKVYYDLLAKKRADDRKDVAIVRLEQLYPLPEKQLEKIFKKYSEAEVVWVQEESANMGAWHYLISNWYGKKQVQLISRKASASPATGFKKTHDKQQKEIVEKA
ncbi:MAG: 2-oxoglutarate dehydrogenase E1 component, partial [Bacteroidota bacterium]